MFQIRIHGRGGQGVVTAAELLSIAAFREGKYAQAFPSFGSERMGAPVAAFCRIDEKPIRLRDPIAAPDALIIQDPTLLHEPSTFSGLRADGFVIVNTHKDPDGIGLSGLKRSLPAGHLVCIPATELARTHIGRPIPNVVMLAAFAALTKTIRLDHLAEAISEKFSQEIAGKNIRAAKAAFDLINEGTGIRDLKQLEQQHKEPTYAKTN